MARAWRIEYEGALYHVLSRGKGFAAQGSGDTANHQTGFTGSTGYNANGARSEVHGKQVIGFMGFVGLSVTK
jgi:hypothetical protein